MEKINIAELLKDCPNGMELDCTLFEKPVKYLSGTYVITIKTSSGHIFYLTKDGCLNDTDDAKCVIFPKGKTTWEGFIPPCKFKDGDVLFVKSVCTVCKVFVSSGLFVEFVCTICTVCEVFVFFVCTVCKVFVLFKSS